MSERFSISAQLKKILFCFFSLISIVLIILSLSLYRTYNTTGIKLIQTYNQRLNTQILSNYQSIDATISELFAQKYGSPEVVKLIYSDKLDPYEENTLLTIWRDISSYPMYHSAIIYNNQAKKNYMSDITSQEASKVLSNIYKGDKLPRTTSIPIEITDSTGKKTLVFSYYMYDYVTSDSVCDGAFILNIKTDWIKELLSTSEIKDLEAVIVDKNGKVILDSDYRYSFSETLKREYLSDLLSDKLDTSFVSMVDGKKTVVSTAKIDKTEWYVIYEQPFEAYEEIMGPVQKQTIILTIVLALVSFVLAFILSLYMYIPIRKLAIFARDVVGDERYGSDDYRYLESALLDSSSQKNQLEKSKTLISKIKKQNYYKTLLREGFLEDDTDEFRECISFLKDGNIFAVLIKSRKKHDKDEVEAILTEWAADCFYQYEFVLIDDFEVILLIKEEGSINILRSKFLEEYPRLQTEIYNNLNITVSLFLTKYYTFPHIDEMMAEMNSLKSYEIMYSAGCCLNFEAIEINHDSSGLFYPTNIANQLLQALKNKNVSDAEIYLDEFLLEVIKNEIESFCVALTRLAFSIQNLYEESRFYKNTELYFEMTNLVGKIMHLGGMDEVKTYFSLLFEFLCSEGSKIEGKNVTLVNSIADYINLTYSDPNLDLNSIAKVFKLSPNYVGKIFREGMDVSISNYLNTVRLNISLELLKNSKKNIKEIIEEIGFINESSFYKLFKKEFGTTPKEFRMDKSLAEEIIRKSRAMS